MDVVVSAVSADLATLFDVITSCGVEVRGAVARDGFKAEFNVSEGDLATVRLIADKRGDSLSVLSRNGFGLYLKSISRRWILLLVCAMIIILSLWLPHRVLFVIVEGNKQISEQEILLAAGECGLFFGADRSGVRSVQIKNYLLERLPDLGWACVNTQGCVATVKVLEKSQSVPMNGSANEVTDIVSVVDGVIIDQQIRSGFPKLQIGQAAKKGQVLVSGTQEDGILERYVRPDAEIYAVTNREYSANLQVVRCEKSYAQDAVRSYSIIFGKKQIKLLKDSRICTTKCDKLYEEYYITLPGGFCLPFGVVIETVREYELVKVDAADSAVQLAQNALEQYLYAQMISGRIVGCNTVRQSDKRITVCYQCTEMIGRESERKFEVSYGKDD